MSKIILNAQKRAIIIIGNIANMIDKITMRSDGDTVPSTFGIGSVAALMFINMFVNDIIKQKAKNAAGKNDVIAVNIFSGVFM